MKIGTEIKLVGAFVGLGGLLFSIFQYVQVQKTNAAAPFLQRKLGWCEEAIETAASIATKQPAEAADIARFNEMYWGVMGLIEDEAISDAMDSYFNAMTPADDAAEQNASRQDHLQAHAQAISHACRAELAQDWSSSWATGR